jgi:hypothetical protein
MFRLVSNGLQVIGCECYTAARMQRTSELDAVTISERQLLFQVSEQGCRIIICRRTNRWSVRCGYAGRGLAEAPQPPPLFSVARAWTWTVLQLY